MSDHSPEFLQTAAKIFSQISSSHSVLLHLHPSPDADSIGSCLSLLHLLESLEKKVTLIRGDSVPGTGFRSLPGFEKITPLTYPELNLAQIDLFLILDSSSTTNISTLGPVKFPPHLKTVVIDHHPTNEHFAQTNLVIPHYPATSQIIYDLLTVWGQPITANMAVNLFAGIYTDTNGFRTPNTLPSTFRVAAALAALNPDFPRVLWQLENSNEPEKIAFISLALSSLEHHFNGQFALAAISSSDLERHHIQPFHTDIVRSQVADILVSVSGWEISCCMVELEPGKTRAIFRTRDSVHFDLTKIIESTHMGGGHKSRAGIVIPMPIADAKRYLLDTLSTTYPSLQSS